jgi:serine/threonine protein kinase
MGRARPSRADRIRASRSLERMTIGGRVLGGRYELRELLGRGGMAEVYLGLDRVLQRPVAVKVLGGWLGDDDRFVERFRREALAAARLSHPDLVAVYDTGSDDGVHYIVMEHVPGETLGDVLRREGRLPAERATVIARSVARALAVAHAAGIVHRDVKPANVMLAPGGRTKVMDLGIARTLEGESLTRTTSILGSPNYLSPEQARGETVDARSDIYSLGCVLYEMLSGRPPFDAESPVAVAYKHVHEDPPLPSAIEPSVPAALDAVTLRAMAKDPDERFRSAEELADALDDRTAPLPVTGATERIPPPAPTARLPRRTDRPPRRNLTPLLIAVLALALVGVAAVALLGGPDPAGGGSSPTVTQEPTRSASPSPSPSTPSPPATTAPTDAVNAAVASLTSLVDEGLANGTISEKAAEEIDKHVEEALKKFAEGDSSEAIEKLDDLGSKIEELVDHDEIANSEKQKLHRAVEDLAAAILTADPPDEESD